MKHIILAALTLLFVLVPVVQSQASSPCEVPVAKWDTQLMAFEYNDAGIVITDIATNTQGEVIAIKWTLALTSTSAINQTWSKAGNDWWSADYDPPLTVNDLPFEEIIPVIGPNSLSHAEWCKDPVPTSITLRQVSASAESGLPLAIGFLILSVITMLSIAIQWRRKLR